MGAFTFTYGTFDSSSDAGVNECALNEFSIDDATGVLRFSTDIFIEADVSSGVEATEDASLVSRVNGAITKLSVENQVFKLKIGSSEYLDWDAATDYSAFDAKPTVTKISRKGSTAKGQFLRFVLVAKREPKESGRNGRRSDMRVSVTYDTSGLRTVEFSGTWTQTASGTSLALARYLASASAYFAASWLDSGQVLAPVTGAVWQKLGTVVTPNDTNRELRYVERYKETEFASDPSNTTDLIYTIGTFTRLDPPTFGAQLIAAGGGGEESPTADGQQTTAADGGGASPLTSYKRFSVTTQTFCNNRSSNLNTLWETVVRPWITASVNAIFGSGRVIFEGPGVPIEDVATKSIRCSTSIIMAAAGTLMLHEESIDDDNDRGLIAEVVYDGNLDSFDLSEGGRRFTVTHNVKQERLDSEPATAAYFGVPFRFLRERRSKAAVVIDPVTQRVIKHVRSMSRTYLYAPDRQSVTITAPAPLGRASRSGGATITPGNGDQEGVEPL